MKKFTNKAIKIILIAILCFIPFRLQAIEYQGVNFSIDNPAISGGGAVSSTSLNFIEKGSISEIQPIGKSIGERFIIRGGFQYYDETPPTISGVAVNDGLGADIDEQTSLNSLSANWGGFMDLESGIRLINPFSYAIIRESDGKFWNNQNLSWQTIEFWALTNSSSTTISSIYLETGDRYFFKVRAYNNANAISNAVISNGVYIIPSLSFSINSGEIDLGILDETNNFTSENASTTLIVSTNAYRGYTVNAWSSSALTNTDYPTESIQDFFGANEGPELWNVGCQNNNSYCAFGYTTNDSALSGGLPDRFTNGGEKYAGFSHLGPGKPTADHTDFVTGATGAVENEEFIIEYKTAVGIDKLPGNYSTVIVFIAIPNF